MFSLVFLCKLFHTRPRENGIYVSTTHIPVMPGSKGHSWRKARTSRLAQCLLIH